MEKQIEADVPKFTRERYKGVKETNPFISRREKKIMRVNEKVYGAEKERHSQSVSPKEIVIEYKLIHNFLAV